MSGVPADGTVVAIDGPAGAGKSTVARRVAEELGLPYLDTGAMYRAVALGLLEEGVDLSDREEVTGSLDSVALDLVPGESEAAEIRLRGEPVAERIRTAEVGEAASKVAAVPAVRRRMVRLQRSFGESHGAVLEGRDIGTVVFPETPHKFFLDASQEERVRRRARERRRKGEAVDEEEVGRELSRRDARDRGRADSPLRADESYTIIDTSDLGIDEVVARVVSSVRSRVTG
ncbi:MAG: (d)CMP kinase [Thermoanaerobaculia bacterium]|nr:(d)CMP kinase [Thermoanaerobaculia bacterium]